MTLSAVLRNFDAAAPHYDRAAVAQATIAKRLVAWAAESGISPAAALDIGSGTGLVAKEINQRWPDARITALDQSPAMLEEARRKMPQLAILTGDVVNAEPGQKFDAIFSSMTLHWLPDPRTALRRWQEWLRPAGKLFVALPVDGSFREWRDLCRSHGVEDGLRSLPAAAFAETLAARTLHETVTIPYPSALEFLRAMKMTGSATPRPDHRSVSPSILRRALNGSIQPFPVRYELMFLSLGAHCS